MKLLFPDIETTVRIKLFIVLGKLNQRHYRRVQANLDFCDSGRCASTQFLQIHKNQLFDLQEPLERYCYVLLVFGVSSAKNDLNLMKYYLLPIPVNERGIEPTIIKKANEFVLFKFGDIQLLDILIFQPEATSLDSFLEAYKTSEAKSFFLYE